MSVTHLKYTDKPRSEFANQVHKLASAVLHTQHKDPDKYWSKHDILEAGELHSDHQKKNWKKVLTTARQVLINENKIDFYYVASSGMWKILNTEDEKKKVAHTKLKTSRTHLKGMMNLNKENEVFGRKGQRLLQGTQKIFNKLLPTEKKKELTEGEK